jgi:hypothetical protein
MASPTVSTKPKSIEAFPVQSAPIQTTAAPTLSQCPKCNNLSFSEITLGYYQCERCNFSQDLLALAIPKEPSFSSANHQAFSMSFLGSIALTTITLIILVL